MAALKDEPVFCTFFDKDALWHENFYGMKQCIHNGSDMTKLLCAVLFMVFVMSSFFAMEGLLSFLQYVMKLLHEQCN